MRFFRRVTLGLAAVLAVLAPLSGAQSFESLYAAPEAALARDGASVPTPAASPVPAPSDPEKTYGVIINGDSAAHHVANVDLFYEHMRAYYRIDAADIIVISTHRGYLSDRRGVDYAARTVKGRVDANDRLVIYTSGHGDLPAGATATTLILHGGAQISATDFSSAFLDNRAARITYIGDQCYSGGFAEAMTSTTRRVLALSASDSTHTTYCQSFIRPYLDAFADPRNDADQDGAVSEKEAFATASKRHREERGDTHGNAQLRESGPAAPAG